MHTDRLKDTIFIPLSKKNKTPKKVPPTSAALFYIDNPQVLEQGMRF